MLRHGDTAGVFKPAPSFDLEEVTVILTPGATAEKIAEHLQNRAAQVEAEQLEIVGLIGEFFDRIAQALQGQSLKTPIGSPSS